MTILRILKKLLTFDNLKKKNIFKKFIMFELIYTKNIDI